MVVKEPCGRRMGCVCVIQDMYSKPQSHVRVNSQYSEEFGVGVSVPRGSLLSHCSSFCCWRRCGVSSTLMCHGSSSTLMTWCSSRTPKRSASPSSRRGRLAWKVKGSESTWRRPSSWSLEMARMSSRKLASTPVLSAVVVSTETLVLPMFAVCPQDVQWHN